MRAKQRNKTSALLLSIGVLFLINTVLAFADNAPALSVLRKPNKRYPIGEPVTYQIRLSWSASAENYRLQAPVTELDNLDYLGISQEVAAGLGPSQETEQIFTFRFTGKGPGPARIRGLRLHWLNEASPEAPGLSLEIPSVEFTVTNPIFHWLLYGSFAFSASLLSIVSLALLFRKRKKQVLLRPQSLEAEIAAELEILREGWKRQSQADFLSALNRTIETYLAQKLDWNRTRDGYNTLRTKAEEAWSKREAGIISESLKMLEENRFSGVPLNDDELQKIYQAFYTFIHGRQI